MNIKHLRVNNLKQKQTSLFNKGIQKQEIIKTISYDQEEIIKAIIRLYCSDGIELDPTYSKGNFYKNIPKPKFIYDINPRTKDTIQADCRKLPHPDNSIKSIMFDPPFIVGLPAKNVKSSSIIANRFSRFKNIHELWKFYESALNEFYRILKINGVLAFKCQDTISSTRQYLSHIKIINYAHSIGFYPKDLFVLLTKHRIIGKYHHKQQHARKFHSYFLVFIKQKSRVDYTSTLLNSKEARL